MLLFTYIKSNALSLHLDIMSYNKILFGVCIFEKHNQPNKISSN